MRSYTEKERKKFRDFAESLKLVRNANLEDPSTGENLIDTLYTDLLPNNGIIDKVNLAKTTIIVGRKGTGKSTIFQKSINAIQQKHETMCIYIDVKSLVENTSIPPIYHSEAAVVSHEDLRRYLTYVEFLRIIINKTKQKINEKLSSLSFFEKFFGHDNYKLGKVIEKLNKIEKSSADAFKKIDLTLLEYIKSVEDNDTDIKLANEVELAANPKIKFKGEFKNKSEIKKEFQNIIGTYIDIRGTLINNLIEIRELLSLKDIYIYLDDFSEIDKDGQEFFIDWFVAPLNNLAEDFIKFKIATYPHRFYDGELDPSKVDTVNLDFFDAFYSSDQNTTNIFKMQDLALNYTKRLLEGRFNYYFADINWRKFFSIDENELYELLFDTSLNVTRKIGYIMYYCYESSLIHDEPISRESIRKAAERYYHDITEKFFLSNTHIKRPFADKISIENQSGLLQEIINNAIAPKKSKKKHLSHFIVNEEISYLLDNLNLQGYISIFNQVRDRGMKTLNVFALDYGLCVYNGIEYHKPSTYTTQEINDSNIAHLITKYFNNTQIIKCKYNHEFEYELLDNIKLFGMICPTCFRNGTTEKCEVYTTNRQLLLKLKQMESIQSNELINYSEFLVLDYLNSKQNSLSAKNFSENVDLSLKTVENVVASLVKRELIEIDKDVSGHVISKTFYRLTDIGKAFIRNITPNN